MPKKRVWICPLICFCLLALIVPGTARTTRAAAYKKQWVKSNSCYYYYDASGNKAVGLKTIGKKTFYFDESGIQRTGWRNIDGYYYFFRPAHARNGYMLKNHTVDGIQLLANGKAVVNDSNELKLNVMFAASALVDKYTKPTWTFARKRYTMFRHTIPYGNAVISDYSHYSNWDVQYAYFLYYRGYGDCYAFAAGFAYFMNAIGYHNVILTHSGGHCWVEWNDHLFDPHYHKAYPYVNTYYVSRAQDGTEGRPYLLGLGPYKKNLDYL